MGFVKPLLAGAVLALNATALDLQIHPNTLLAAKVIGNAGEQDLNFIGGTETGALLVNNYGASVDAALEVVREANLTRVNVATTITVNPEANGGLLEYSGEFTLSEPAYVQFFGHLAGNSVNPSAVSYLFATSTSVENPEELYEYEYQYGQVPDSVAIDGQVGPEGGLAGNLAETRLLQPGTYTFYLEISAWDFAATADTAFTTSGNFGFTAFTETTPPPPPPPDAPTIQDLIALVDAYAELGDIRPGIANALRSQLNYANGQHGSRAKPQMLGAFLHHVSAQAGKHISEPASAELTLLALDVLEGLNGAE